MELILDPAGEPAANMDRDEQIVQAVRRGEMPPTLRIYQWDQPAISLGRHQRADDLPSSLLKQRWPIVHRLTGGGAVIHSREELTYALVIPTSMVPSSIRLNQIPGFFHRRFLDEFIRREGLKADEISLCQHESAGPALLCFSTPVCGDLLYRGKKVGGAALRVWRDVLLIQGSIQGLPVMHDVLASCLKIVLTRRIDFFLN